MNAVGHSVVLTVTSCHNNPQHAVTGKYISVYDRNKSLFFYWFSLPTSISLPSLSLVLFRNTRLSFRYSELKTDDSEFVPLVPIDI